MRSASERETRNRKPENYSGEIITHSPDETFTFAKRIGEQLQGGEVFLLKGELGAGKTVFAKGVAAGLGINPAEVTSPSFTLVNAHEGRLRFYHIDLYRLDAGSQSALGLEEILDDDKAVTVIEWAERLRVVPAGATEVEMSHVSESERKISIG
jgi:tRNA threonylcarbamoyladenosine biosynthesis protein TsaE